VPCTDGWGCREQALEKYNIEKDIAAYIKKEFDKKYNPTWHCIVGRNFGASNTPWMDGLLGQLDASSGQPLGSEGMRAPCWGAGLSLAPSVASPARPH